MPKPQSATNPFYVLLIIAGVMFVITAFAYFTMAVREVDGTAASRHGLTALLARHGLTVLIVELLLLAVATFGAIGTDEYWTRRAVTRARGTGDDGAPFPYRDESRGQDLSHGRSFPGDPNQPVP